MNAPLPRFEVRSCRSGFIQTVTDTFDAGKAYADGYHAEVGHDDSFCIVDTFLPVVEGDLRIVWREGDLTPRAEKWLRDHAHQGPLTPSC
jgi:hypothetical protein